MLESGPPTALCFATGTNVINGPGQRALLSVPPLTLVRQHLNLSNRDLQIAVGEAIR